MTGEDPLPAGDPIFDWAEAHQRMVALSDRIAAGEDVTNAEAVEMLQDILQKFYDVEPKLACLLDTDRCKALVDRMVAGEQVDDAEVQAMVLDHITNMDGTAS